MFVATNHGLNSCHRSVKLSIFCKGISFAYSQHDVLFMKGNTTNHNPVSPITLKLMGMVFPHPPRETCPFNTANHTLLDSTFHLSSPNNLSKDV